MGCVRGGGGEGGGGQGWTLSKQSFYGNSTMIEAVRHSTLTETVIWWRRSFDPDSPVAETMF